MRQGVADEQTVNASHFGISVPGNFALNGAITDASGALDGEPTYGTDIKGRYIHSVNLSCFQSISTTTTFSTTRMTNRFYGTIRIYIFIYAHVKIFRHED